MFGRFGSVLFVVGVDVHVVSWLFVVVVVFFVVTHSCDLFVNTVHSCNEHRLVVGEGALVAVKEGDPRSGALAGGKRPLFSRRHVSHPLNHVLRHREGGPVVASESSPGGQTHEVMTALRVAGGP